MEKRSLGLIETWGLVPAIEAADVGAKAANVILLGYEVVPVGRIVVTFVGDVAAVTASVSAGAAAAGKLGQVLAVHVIPRPDAQIRIAPPSPPPIPEGKTQVQESQPSALVPEPKLEAEPQALPSHEEKGGEEPPERLFPPEEKITETTPKPPFRRKKKGAQKKAGVSKTSKKTQGT